MHINRSQMRHIFFVTITLGLANIAEECHGTSAEIFVPLQSAVRLRFNDDIFQQFSRVVEYLFKKHIQQMVIPPQQQCFPEGCVRIQDFQLVAHQNPSYVGVVPTPPNLLKLTISGFNFHIAGTLYGQLKPLLLLPVIVPIYGTLVVSANQLVIEATFDIQKTVHNVPFIRLVGCSLINEVILAWVENMGLFTVIANTKYQHEITTKSRQILEETFCITVNNVVNSELNTVLLQVPNQISIFNLYRILFEKSDDSSGQKMRRVLGPRPNHLRVQHNMQMNSGWVVLPGSQLNKGTRLFSASPDSHKIEPEILNSSATFPVTPTIQKSKEIPSTLNKSFKNSWKKLVLLILSLSVLDTSATYGKFFVGLDGDVYIRSHYQTKNPYRRPGMLRFTEIADGNDVDLLISEYTINTLLLKAHVIDALVTNVSSTTPVLGKLIRTSCGIDEVCLSDIIPEVAETYPDKQLEIILRTTEPPQATILAGAAIVTLKGQATLFVEGTTEKAGVIPFNTTIQCNIISSPNRITGLMKIKTLQFDEQVDFFGLPLQSLNGFKEATKGAVLKLVNGILRQGITLNESPKLPLSNTSISLVNRAILLQTKFDIARSFYQQMSIPV